MNKLKDLSIALCALICMGASASAQQNQCGGDKTPSLPKQWTGLYQGTVAGLPVVIQLGKRNTYFYNKTGLDIEFEASLKGQTLILHEKGDQAHRSHKTTACFSLTIKGQQLGGTWQKINSQKTYPVRLTRINPEKIALKLNKTSFLIKLRRDNPYELLKINSTWKILNKGQTVIEPLSQVKYPRLPEESKALNNALQDLQAQLALEKLSCKAFGGEHFYYEYQHSPLFKNKKLVSFDTSAHYYCGGAHPSSSMQGLILDRLTGQTVALKSLFGYLDKKELKHIYQKKAAKMIDSECLNVLSESDYFDFVASLTKTGLQITPVGFPHVYQVCSVPVIIPYAALEQYMSKESVYFGEFYK